VLKRLKARGFDADKVGRLSAFIIDEMRKGLATYRDAESAKLFGERLDSGKIEFRVRGDEGDWIMPDHIWTSASESAPRLTGKTGAALERSLFLPIYSSELNKDETKVAIYLDAEAVIKWWHRNGTERGSYALRGWRRGNVYPDFVFAALRDDTGQRIVALESKGDHLDNLDTAYKRTLLERLTAAYGEKAVGKSGELDLGSQSADYEAAVVLFKDMDRELPKLIGGIGETR
jgi:type III restriction enzyme